ncbi:unnamed protein product [Penicillium bialowiezense]
MSNLQTPILDHIVILVSHKTLLELSKHTEGQFTLAPGGNHADGLTTNKLILLADGVYLEFIAFFDNVDPKRRSAHRWGNEKEDTIIDWAFTLRSEDDFGAVQKRFKGAETEASYTDPIAGGRTKPDGTVLEWAVVPGSLPFWCLDRTPRANRVPYQVEPQLTQHPNGIQGISAVAVHVPKEKSSSFKGAYDAIFGGAWDYQVPSESTTGTHGVTLSEGGASVRLVFSGLKQGQVELLPGLVFDIEGQ